MHSRPSGSGWASSLFEHELCVGRLQLRICSLKSSAQNTLKICGMILGCRSISGRISPTSAECPPFVNSNRYSFSSISRNCLRISAGAYFSRSIGKTPRCGHSSTMPSPEKVMYTALPLRWDATTVTVPLMLKTGCSLYLLTLRSFLFSRNSKSLSSNSRFI